MIVAKKKGGKYVLPQETSLFIAQMLEAGPVPTTTLRELLKNFYPTSVQITAEILRNIKLKCNLMQKQYTSVQETPKSVLDNAFESTSLEVLPEMNAADSTVISDIISEYLRDMLKDGSSNDDFPLASLLARTNK